MYLYLFEDGLESLETVLLGEMATLLNRVVVDFLNHDDLQ